MSRFARRLQQASASLLTMQKGPISFSDLTAARASLRSPADANYVLWNPAWPADRDLEDVFALELAANDILVLPERPEPYVIDSSEGFRAAGVQSVTGRYGQLPIVNRYKNIRNARTWFAMARARRGVLGLGPNAIIEISTSAWTQERQIEDSGSVQDDGWVSPGRFYTGTDGLVKSELVGCQEKVLEAAHASPYFGNFVLRAHDLGGVAFSGVTAINTSPIIEHLNVSGGWRGFSGVPNGEACGLGSGGSNYLISRCIVGTRDGDGTRVGSSPVMINSSSGGRIEDMDIGESIAGMLTLWNCSGKHTFSNVNCRFNYGPGLNLEQCQAGFELEWLGGSDWSDYYGNGGKTPKPADQGTNGRLHIQLNSPGGSAKITLRDVDIDIGPTAGAINIQLYGSPQQQLADIHRFDSSGNALPIKVYY